MSERAIEAAAKFAECSISRQGEFMQMTPEEIDHIWKSAMASGRGAVLVKKYETFLKAFLNALAEDDAVVERVADAIHDAADNPFASIPNVRETMKPMRVRQARAAIRAMGGE